MITFRVNIVALIPALFSLWVIVQFGLRAGLTYQEMAGIAIPVALTVRAYDWIADRPALRGNKGRKDGGK